MPSAMASAEPSAYLAIEVEIDMGGQTIVDLACTAFPVLCERILETLLIGKEPVAGIGEASPMIERRYHGAGKAAVMTALRNALQEYRGNA